MLVAPRHAVLSLLLVACGGSDGPAPTDGGPRPDTGSAVTVSCANHSAGLEAPIEFCTEYPNLGTFELIGVRSACDATHRADAGPPYLPDTTFSDGPCSRVDIIGSCTSTTSGVRNTLFWYAPRSPDDYRESCERDGGTWAPP